MRDQPHVPTSRPGAVPAHAPLPHDEAHHAGPRVRVSRRAALRSALAVPAFLAVSSVARAAHGSAPYPGPPDPRSADGDTGREAEIAAFLEEWQTRTAAAVEAGATDDDAHLHGLLADLARLDLDAFPKRMKDAFGSDEFVSGPILASPTFLVLEFELAPGAPIQAHNHVGFSFVSVGVEGDAIVSHYEPAEADYPDPGSELDVPFPLQEVQRTVLTRGRSSSLTRTRANIHAFRAGPEGARFFDFGVNYGKPAGGYTSFSKLVVDEAPQDLARGIHTARWIGNPKD